MIASQPRCPAHPEAQLGDYIQGAQDQFFGLPGEYVFKQCADCQALVLAPRPQPSEIGHFYSGYYPEETLKQLRARAERGRRVGLAGRLRAIGFVKRFEALDAALTAQTKHLDVGCGLGAFSGALQKRSGIQSKGVDFSPECADFAKQVHGIDVDVGELTAQAYPDDSFDILTAWHYMEHVYNPQAELQEMARITKPGGWLMVETPTPSALAAIFKKRWLYLMPPTHLYHYTPETLCTLIEAAGYEVVKVERPWFPGELAGSLMFACGLQGLVPKVFSPGRPLHQRLLTFVLLAQMVYDVPITLLLAKINKSGLLRIFARKR